MYFCQGKNNKKRIPTKFITEYMWYIEKLKREPQRKITQYATKDKRKLMREAVSDPTKKYKEGKKKHNHRSMPIIIL